MQYLAELAPNGLKKWQLTKKILCIPLVCVSPDLLYPLTYCIPLVCVSPDFMYPLISCIPLFRVSPQFMYPIISGKDFICVQSMDGSVSIFEQESFAFTRFLPGALLPGPIKYNPRVDSFVTVSSSWQIECYKYVLHV